MICLVTFESSEHIRCLACQRARLMQTAQTYFEQSLIKADSTQDLATLCTKQKQLCINGTA